MIRRYWRFLAFLATGALVTALCWQRLGPAAAALLGFDAGAIVFFAALVSLVRGAGTATMRERSQANELDHHLLLVLSMGTVAITLLGVWTELGAISVAADDKKGAIVGLSAISLAIVWFFANALAAIHYAHLWYLSGDDGEDCRGLDFPAADMAPDYLDFAYYALVLSMTFQVSDVTTSSKSMRRLALVHSLVAFIFNITVIALSVSLVTSMLGQ